MAALDAHLRPPPGRDADAISRLLFVQEQVISRRQALRHLRAKALRHRLETGRWQTPHPGVYVAHSGPISTEQRRWIAGWSPSG